MEDEYMQKKEMDQIKNALEETREELKDLKKARELWLNDTYKEFEKKDIIITALVNECISLKKQINSYKDIYENKKDWL
jgi:archaellum component FlaC